MNFVLRPGKQSKPLSSPHGFGGLNVARARRSRGVRQWTIGAPLLIVLLSLALRVIWLTSSPPGFFCDEAIQGLDAQALGHTLRDTHGHWLPFFLESLGDWRGALHAWCQAPWVWVFGLSEWSVRLGSAVVGTLTVWLCWIYTRRALGWRAGLLSALLLAISPWHLIHSRAGWDVIGVPFVTLIFLVAATNALKRPRRWPLVGLLTALGFYTYVPGRLFLPALWLVWMVLHWRFLRRRDAREWLGWGVAVFIMAMVPALFAIHDGVFFTRWQQLDQSVAPGQRMRDFGAHYMAHFAPSFLFSGPDDWILRHWVRGFGMLFWFEAPFLIVGVYAMLYRFRRADRLHLAWLLLYPVAASLVGNPVSTRSITGMIVFQIAAAQGMIAAYDSLKWLKPAMRYRVRAFGVAQITILGVLSSGSFGRAYFGDYPLYADKFYGWQWGARPIAAFTADHAGEYDNIFWNADFNAPESLRDFYLPVGRAGRDKTNISNLIEPSDWGQHFQPARRQLWVIGAPTWAVLPRPLPAHQVVHRLSYANGEPAFVFIFTGPATGALQDKIFLRLHPAPTPVPTSTPSITPTPMPTIVPVPSPAPASAPAATFAP